MDKNALLKPRLGERVVELPGVGEVRVRGLSRDEMATYRDKDGYEAEILAVSMALIDPQMTPDEVAEWFRVSPAMESQPVIQAVNELSGMAGWAQRKETYKSV